VSIGDSALAPLISRCAEDSSGLFILENTFREKGGPPRHLHYDQDEWFYAIEGCSFSRWGRKIKLKPGDSLLAPRKVTHVWADVGDGRGRILIAFIPAGKMEAFFREVTKANAMPPLDPGLWSDVLRDRDPPG